MSLEKKMGVVILQMAGKHPASRHLDHLVESVNERYGKGAIDTSVPPVEQLEQVVSLKYDLTIEEAYDPDQELHILKFRTRRGDRNELSRALKDFERMVRSLLGIKIKSFLTHEGTLHPGGSTGALF